MAELGLAPMCTSFGAADARPPAGLGGAPRRGSARATRAAAAAPAARERDRRRHRRGRDRGGQGVHAALHGGAGAPLRRAQRRHRRHPRLRGVERDVRGLEAAVRPRATSRSGRRRRSSARRTPCARRVQAFADAGFDHIILHTVTPGAPRAVQQRWAERFAREVAPRFSPAFDAVGRAMIVRIAADGGVSLARRRRLQAPARRGDRRGPGRRRAGGSRRRAPARRRARAARRRLAGARLGRDRRPRRVRRAWSRTRSRRAGRRSTARPCAHTSRKCRRFVPSSCGDDGADRPGDDGARRGLRAPARCHLRRVAAGRRAAGLDRPGRPLRRLADAGAGGDHAPRAGRSRGRGRARPRRPRPHGRPQRDRGVLRDPRRARGAGGADDRAAPRRGRPGGGDRGRGASSRSRSPSAPRPSASRSSTTPSTSPCTPPAATRCWTGWSSGSSR